MNPVSASILVCKDEEAVANYIKDRDVHRLTLTIPVLCRAETIVILALGDEKSGPLREALQGEYDRQGYPV